MRDLGLSSQSSVNLNSGSPQLPECMKKMKSERLNELRQLARGRRRGCAPWEAEERLVNRALSVYGVG